MRAADFSRGRSYSFKYKLNPKELKTLLLLGYINMSLYHPYFFVRNEELFYIRQKSSGSYSGQLKFHFFFLFQMQTCVKTKKKTTEHLWLNNAAIWCTYSFFVLGQISETNFDVCCTVQWEAKKFTEISSSPVQCYKLFSLRFVLIWIIVPR